MKRLLFLIPLVLLMGCSQQQTNVSEESESANLILEEIVSENEIEVTISENEIEIIEEVSVSENIIVEEDEPENVEEEPIIIQTTPDYAPVVEVPAPITPEPITYPREDWTSTPGKANSHILLIGDSRLVTLCVYTDIEKKYKVIAQGGADCTFIGTQFPCFIFTGNGYKFNTFNDQTAGTVNLTADVLEEEGVDTIVFMLGVNDIFNQFTYGLEGYDAIFKINYALYVMKFCGCKVIFNDIGYIRTDTGTQLFDACTNDVIDSFNSQIINYDARINCFAGMPNSTNCDGVHYAPEDMESIYRLLISYIGN